jgi:hypothetical protein
LPDDEVSRFGRTTTAGPTAAATCVHPEARASAAFGQTAASARAQTAYELGDTSRTMTDLHGPPGTPSTTRLPLSLTTAVC